MLYFAYGSNLLRRRLEGRIGPMDALPQIAVARGFELRFHKRGRDGSGKADAHAFEGGEVVGALYRLSEKQIAILDGFETGYRRRSLTVSSDGGDFTAWSYFAEAAFVDPALRPFDWYVEFILAGARSVGFPDSYLDALRAHPCDADRDVKRIKLARDLLASR